MRNVKLKMPRLFHALFSSATRRIIPPVTLRKIVQTNVPSNCKRGRATTSLLKLSFSVWKQGDAHERRAAFIDGIATISGPRERMVDRLSLSLAGCTAGH